MRKSIQMLKLSLIESQGRIPTFSRRSLLILGPPQFSDFSTWLSIPEKTSRQQNLEQRTLHERQGRQGVECLLLTTAFEASCSHPSHSNRVQIQERDRERQKTERKTKNGRSECRWKIRRQFAEGAHAHLTL